MSKIVLTPDLIHYAKEVTDNGKFISWVSDPNEIPYKEKCEVLVEEASQYENDSFAESVIEFFQDKGFLTTKQYAALSKYVEAKETERERFDNMIGATA